MPRAFRSGWPGRNATLRPSSIGVGMVGKTMRVTKHGIAPATNGICGYLIVEAETAQAAARLFEDHPHITVFPGDGVDIMPFVTDPPE